jgi:exopolysaccharide biosynthesis polyprenyl glycosylphosphotransferase
MRASSLERLLLFCADFAALYLCFFGSYWIQFHSGLIVDKYDPTRSFDMYLHTGVVVTLVWQLSFALTGLYRKWLLESRIYQLLCVAKVMGAGLVLLLAALFGNEMVMRLFQDDNAPSAFTYGSRFYLVLSYGLGGILLVGLLRMGVYLVLRRFLRHGFGADRVLLLGATDAGAIILEQLRKNPQLGQRVVGVVDERRAKLPHDFEGLPVLGKYSDLPRLVQDKHISSIIISHESSSVQEITRILGQVARLPIHIYVIPDLYDVVSGHFKANLVHKVELKEMFAFNMPPWQVAMKRAIDITVAAGLLVCSAPLLALTAIAIKLDSRGPVLYSQERVGLYGRKFMVYKFRSMVTDAEKNGPQWAKKNDARVTRVGKLIRKTRIDEIPQLFCVLKGDMSMVGPRPERAHFIDKLRNEIPFYVSRLKMKPGLTGWAQVRHHYDTSIEDVYTKLRYDLYYFENMSLLLDIQILFRTVYVVLTGKGAQ